MQKPSSTESLRRILDRLVYHRAQLDASAVLPDLRAPLTAWIETATALLTDRQTARERILVGLARRDRADRLADTGLRRFELAALALVDRNRADVRYVRLFHPQSCSILTRLPIPDEVKALRRLADALDHDDLASLRDPHQLTLRTYADALDATETELRAALDERGVLASRLTLLRLDVIRMLQKNYADLLALHPHDKDEAESHFLKLQRKGRARGGDVGGVDLGGEDGEDDPA